MILYCNHVNNVKHFPSLFSKMAGFYQWKENNNNSNFAHPKQACNNAQQGNVTP